MTSQPPAETPYYSTQRGGYLPLPPAVPARYHAALPALRLYTARQLAREQPAGHRDSAGRWYPTADERRPCCDRVRSPSRAWPSSLLTHCRTAGHCAGLTGVAPHALRSLLAFVVRYYQDVGAAPWLCPVCGASWACEHLPGQPDGSHDGLLPVPDHRADMSRHLPCDHAETEDTNDA